MENLEAIVSKFSNLFHGDESLSEISKAISKDTVISGDAEISEVDIQAVAKLIRSAFPVSKRLPQLIADWGVAPEIGMRCIPEFLLICGDGYSEAELDVKFELDQQLDCTAADCQPRLRRNEEGHWGFDFPFRLTTDGNLCAPGIYNLKLELEFAGLDEPELPAKLFCIVRLKILSADAGKSVLEIDSDDKALINLQGMNLRSFSKIKLKGSGSGIINILQSQTETSPEGELSDGGDVAQNITHTYPLLFDSDAIEDELWTACSTRSRKQLRKACLQMSDGRNIVLLAQEQIKFGRNRDMDIVTRFLPRGADNDDKTRKLSRFHFVATFGDEGLEFINRSTSGIEINFDRVVDTWTLSGLGFSETTKISLGDLFSGQLSMAIVSFSSDAYKSRYSYGKERRRIELFAESEHLRWNKLWRFGELLNLDAIRIERENNLTEEEYVVVCQQALIGAAENKCSIHIPDVSNIAARILYIGSTFWLNRLDDSLEVSVDGHSLDANEMVPLAPGQTLAIDTVTMEFIAFSQLHM